MKWRRLFVIVGSLAVIFAIALVWHPRRSSEPNWQGKSLPEWFSEFRKAKTKHRNAVTFWLAGAPGPSTGYTEDIGALLRDPTADGLRAMGTNAVPFLEAELRRRDSGWARSYRPFYYKLPTTLRKLAPTPPVSRDEIRSDAALALAALGTDAAAAVPSIIYVFGTEANLRRMGSLNESLRRLPRPREAFDQTLESLCLRGELNDAVRAIEDFQVVTIPAARILTNAVLSTNSWAKDSAIRQLSRFRPYANFVLPALIAALGSSDGATRQSAATVLESFGAEAAGALPALVTALKSEDGELRYRAARALENMGPNALPALPALTAATNDSNPMVQRVAVRTLKNLGVTGVNPSS